ncbi:nitronate monooxygenase [Rhodopseudomonas sp. P2A-2r]|uniref:NAD(P)H-dependent flavin oxidoreductase n=1 Tax=Rhodopseudomonas sp. P2A-2r TaxID=2991972 RepID=UPI0022345475|nr:nitronate monooxygenase [Rhodopseudomonas sp. P2A-2r]UZE50826.1 nitronate monooxygenase [Rhodopseudomonas sp. P2A-2r]
MRRGETQTRGKRGNILQAPDRLARFRDRLRLPLIAAPMFLVSGVELVVAACSNGVIGSFPSANCRTAEQLDGWLGEISERLRSHADATGQAAAPVCPNLIVHRSNLRLADDLAVVLRHAPELVITSVGSPAPVLAQLHDVGALVFADVASIRHAERAVVAGADGLVLLTAGAGGQTGWLNPFVFVRAVRQFFDGPVVLAGGICDGHALRAAQALGCDLAYMGTRFIATHESMADTRYKEMLVVSSADDILLTTAFTGLQTNMLRPSIVAAGLDPEALPARGAIDIAEDIDVGARDGRPARWRDIWSAGQSTSGVNSIVSVAELVGHTAIEYRG